MLAPGKVRLSLDYLRGKDGLKIDWAALLENGHEIVRDEHSGFTATSRSKGPKARDWNYFFDVPQELPASAANLPLRRGLLMAIKEALNNAVKHSGATEFRLQIRFRHERPPRG